MGEFSFHGTNHSVDEGAFWFPCDTFLWPVGANGRIILIGLENCTDSPVFHPFLSIHARESWWIYWGKVFDAHAQVITWRRSPVSSGATRLPRRIVMECNIGNQGEQSFFIFIIAFARAGGEDGENQFAWKANFWLLLHKFFCVLRGKALNRYAFRVGWLGVYHVGTVKRFGLTVVFKYFSDTSMDFFSRLPCVVTSSNVDFFLLMFCVSFLWFFDFVLAKNPFNENLLADRFAEECFCSTGFCDRSFNLGRTWRRRRIPGVLQRLSDFYTWQELSNSKILCAIRFFMDPLIISIDWLIGRLIDWLIFIYCGQLIFFLVFSRFLLDQEKIAFVIHWTKDTPPGAPHRFGKPSEASHHGGVWVQALQGQQHRASHRKHGFHGTNHRDSPRRPISTASWRFQSAKLIRWQ